MGEQYKARLEEIVADLGPERLRVYLNPAGVSAVYRKHVEDTFSSLNVTFVATRDEANFVFDGHSEPARREGQIVAIFRDNELVVEGALAS